jgi:hypothetical protein
VEYIFMIILVFIHIQGMSLLYIRIRDVCSIHV